MGGSSNPNIPTTQGGSNLGPYTSSLVNAGHPQPDSAALSAYQQMFGTQPTMRDAASANAMRLINALPLQAGSYLTNPATAAPARPVVPTPVNPYTGPTTRPNGTIPQQQQRNYTRRNQ